MVDSYQASMVECSIFLVLRWCDAGGLSSARTPSGAIRPELQFRGGNRRAGEPIDQMTTTTAGPWPLFADL